jgi:16S rRNA G966 N2-methylase RsmD/Zn finger protein HypA/HybF involved in hydrogenase expression
MKIIDRIPSDLIDAVNTFSRKLEWSRRLPIYETHKWWARRYSGAVRLLLAFTELDDKVLKKIKNYDAFVEEVYLNPPKVKNKRLLDPFCGGGTIIIEGAMLGYLSYGIELNKIPYLVCNSLKTLPKINTKFIEDKIISTSHKLNNLWSTKCNRGHDATIIHTFLAWKTNSGELQIKFNKLRDGGKKIYYCEKCNRIYTSSRNLVKCIFCGNKFNKKYDKIEHRQLVPYAVEYYCPFCNGRDFKIATPEDIERFNFNFKRKLFRIPLLNETRRLIKAGLNDFSQLLTSRQLYTYYTFLNSFKIEPYKTIAKLLVSDSLRSCSILAYYSPKYRKVIPGFVIKSYWLPPQPVELNPLSYLFSSDKKELTPLGRGTIISTLRKLRRAKDFIKSQKLPLNFKIYYGPAQEIIPKLNTKFNVIFTDPPYGDYQFYSDLSLFSLSIIHEINSKSLKKLLEAEVVLRDKKDLITYKNRLHSVFNLAVSKLLEEGKVIVTFHHYDTNILYEFLDVFKNLPISLHAIYPIVGESSGHLTKRKLYLDLVFVFGRDKRKPYYTFTSKLYTKYDKKLQDMIEKLVDFYKE